MINKKNISKLLLKTTFLVLLSVGMLSPSACSNLNLGEIAKTASSFEKPTIAIKSLSLGEGSNLEKINFKLTLDVENKNDVAIKTSSIDYALDLAKTQLVTDNLENGVEILAKKTTSIDLPISIKTQDLLKVGPSILLNLNNLDYKVAATINFETPVGKLPIKLEKEDKINLGSLLSLLASTIKL